MDHLFMPDEPDVTYKDNSGCYQKVVALDPDTGKREIVLRNTAKSKKLTFSVKNDTSNPLTVRTVVDPSNFPGEDPFEKYQIDIEKGGTGNFKLKDRYESPGKIGFGVVAVGECPCP